MLTAGNNYGLPEGLRWRKWTNGGVDVGSNSLFTERLVSNFLSFFGVFFSFCAVSDQYGIDIRGSKATNVTANGLGCVWITSRLDRC